MSEGGREGRRVGGKEERREVKRVREKGQGQNAQGNATRHSALGTRHSANETSTVLPTQQMQQMLSLS